MKNKMFVVATGMAVIASAIVASAPQAEASTKTFKDVPKSSPYYDIINEMVSLGIISGYEDGTFKPNENITRKHAVAMISRIPGLKFEQKVKSERLNDIKSSDKNYKFYHDMQRAGIIIPDKDGNFNANKLVTRGEMAKMIDRAFGLKADTTDSFVDVSAEDLYLHGSVSRLYTLGITTGDNGKFHPDKNLTRVHFATFIHRTLNQDPDFVAGPIEKEIKYRTSGKKYNDTGMITDFYNSGWDIPLPKGETYISLREKQVKDFNRLRVKNKTNSVGAWLITGQSSLMETSLEARSKLYRMTREEFVEIINQTIKTGEVYDGEFFILYFNFEEGRLFDAYNNRYDHGDE